MLNYIILQAGGSSMYGQLILFAAVGLIFYFFMLRPQQKKQKEQKIFRENLKVGDKVVTIGGVHGKIVEISAETIVLDVDRGVKITYEKSSISDELSKKFIEK